MAIFRGIPSRNNVKDPEVRRILNAIVENLEGQEDNNGINQQDKVIVKQVSKAEISGTSLVIQRIREVWEYVNGLFVKRTESDDEEIVVDLSGIDGVGPHILDDENAHLEPDDTTYLDATINRHGLLIKGNNDNTTALLGDITWGNPAPAAHTHTHDSTTGKTANDHHNQQHDLDATADHNGIAGSVDNLMAINANGLPKDSGYSAADLTPSGTSDDIDEEYIDEIDYSTDDELTFSKRTLVLDHTNGLTDTATAADGTSDVVLFGGNWISQEGGTIFHDVMGSDTSEDLVTLYVAASSGGAVTTAIVIDNCGHIRKYSSTEAPGGTQKYLYRNCDNSSETHWDTDDLGAFLEAETKCWERSGPYTTGDSEEWNPTVTATYASCAACDTGGVNEVIYDCDDDSIIGYASPGNVPTDSYFWWYDSSYKEAYRDGTKSAATATDANYYEEPGVTPTQCPDLDGWTLSDDFGGTGDNSSDTDGSDENWNIRFPSTTSGATIEIVSGNLELQEWNQSVSTYIAVTTHNAIAYDGGDFTVSLDFQNAGHSGTRSSQYITEIMLLIILGSTTYQVWLEYNHNISQNSWVWTGGSQTGVGQVSSGTLTISRSSGTVSIIAGGSTRRTLSDSGDLNRITIAVGNAQYQTVEVTSLTVTDGSGNPIKIDPNGVYLP